jgi:disulfide bond formation protein DsbB
VTVDNASLLAALLTVAALAAFAVMMLGLIGGRYSANLAALRDWGVETIGPVAMWFAWGVAAVSLLGSIYFSEVADFVPCNLCWYQRIAMYPLVVILAIAAARNDVAIRRYVFPLTGIGMVFSIYHHFLQLYPSIETGVCGTDVSCVTRDIWELGFVSFPLMALAGFLLVTALLVVAARFDSQMRLASAPLGAGSTR